MARFCEICTKKFKPLKSQPEARRCRECRELEEERESSAYLDYRPGFSLPKAKTHVLAPPLVQAVFDLETISLDRSFGVLLVGSILTFGAGEPKLQTFDLTQTKGWPGTRSNDSELAARIIQVLSEAHVLYAHNGLNFDIPWLNTIALRYGLPPLKQKLIDPVQVARRNYRLGSNSLASLADFLDAPERKLPLAPEVWRKAIFDADPVSWDLLRERCESDVRVLAYIAGKVTRDVGLIDRQGSAFRQ